ncbi:MFS transporter [Ktedonosporobacter rubrisoli]|uniref:MFS transporter n=1 Tax=Ktedonosporobacter rubrisoli TaxID=2509675 RepID=A0A4P6JUY6_KTERU|nr:MFS transporter [Ktedonosporobacter rubrisoli]QBD79163.1 MFS transporter [Ktedonosporobacter rubrisoli]
MSHLIEYIKMFGRFQRNARLYLVSNALSGITMGALLVLYNLYLVELGYRTDFIGLVLFVSTIGAGLAIFPAGICVDRFGGKPILIWSSVLIGIAGAGQILFRTPIPLLVSGFVAGIGAAFVLVVNAPFLTENSTPAERPHLFSLNIVVSLATSVLGEFIGGSLPLWLRSTPWLMEPLPHWLAWTLVSAPEPRSYQLALLAAGIIATPSFVPLFMLKEARRARPEPIQLASLPRLDKQGLLNNVNRWRQIISGPIFVMIVIQALIGLGAGMLIPYFNVYFVRQLGASPALFGAIDGGANTLNACLTLLAPWLATRIGKVNTITVTRLISIPLLLIIGLSHDLPLAATLYLFRMGAMDMSQGIFQVFSMEVAEKKHRGLANSSYQVAGQVSRAIVAPLAGFIIASLGFAPVFIIGAAFYLLAIAGLWGWYKINWSKREDQKLAEDELASRIPEAIPADKQ